MSPIRRSVLAASPNPTTTRSDLASEQDVDELVLRATQAHVALMRGDQRHYRALLPYADDFMLMSPFGGKPTRGAPLSDERWEQIGRFFRNGRDSTLELVQAYRSTDLVVLAAIERTHVQVGDIPEQDWALRVTLVFRKDRGRWLLAHRHADALAGGISVEQAALLARSSESVRRE